MQTATRPGGDGAALVPNVLRAGIESNRITDPCNIVFFGATGDLANRMLYPAMYNLRLEDILPSSFGIVGFSRTEESDETFRANVQRSIETYSRSGPPREPLWSDFARRLSYVTGNFDDPASYERLRAQLERNDKELATAGNHLFYLSYAAAGLSQDRRAPAGGGARPNPEPATAGRGSSSRSRSAPISRRRARCRPRSTKSFPRTTCLPHRSLPGQRAGAGHHRAALCQHHLRADLEPQLRGQRADHAAESIGVEERGGYYDHAGALRDMIQNHVHQSAGAGRDGAADLLPHADEHPRRKVQGALGDSSHRPAPTSQSMIGARTVRARYRSTDAGRWATGKKPTCRPELQHRDVRGGKVLHRQLALGRRSVLRALRQAAGAQGLGDRRHASRQIPHRFYGELDRHDRAERARASRFSPTRASAMRFEAKVPGPKMHVRSVYMDFNYGTRLRRRVAAGVRTSDRRCDARRSDALHALGRRRSGAWEIVTPILETWLDRAPSDFPNYESGSQGPRSAEELLAADGRQWRSI